MVLSEKTLHNKWMTIFFYALCLVTFITVAIFVYAGKQTELVERDFGDVKMKNKFVKGISSEDRDIVTMSDGDTLDISSSKMGIYIFPSTIGAGTSFTFPTKAEILKKFPEKKNGVNVDLGDVFNRSTSETVTINLTDGVTRLTDPLTTTIGTGESIGLVFIYQDGNLLWVP